MSLLWIKRALLRTVYKRGKSTANCSYEFSTPRCIRFYEVRRFERRCHPIASTRSKNSRGRRDSRRRRRLFANAFQRFQHVVASALGVVFEELSTIGVRQQPGGYRVELMRILDCHQCGEVGRRHFYA